MQLFFLRSYILVLFRKFGETQLNAEQRNGHLTIRREAPKPPICERFKGELPSLHDAQDPVLETKGSLLRSIM